MSARQAWWNQPKLYQWKDSGLSMQCGCSCAEIEATSTHRFPSESDAVEQQLSCLVTKNQQIYVKRRSLSFVNIQFWTLYLVESWLNVRSWEAKVWIKFNKQKMSNPVNNQPRKGLTWKLHWSTKKTTNLSATEFPTILDKVDRVKYLFYLFCFPITGVVIKSMHLFSLA